MVQELADVRHAHKCVEKSHESQLKNLNSEALRMKQAHAAELQRVREEARLYLTSNEEKLNAVEKADAARKLSEERYRELEARFDSELDLNRERTATVLGQMKQMEQQHAATEDGWKQEIANEKEAHRQCLQQLKLSEKRVRALTK